MIRFLALAVLLIASPAIADSPRGYLPEGYLTFCTQNPALCAPQAGGLATVEQAETVNQAVNAAIKFRDDPLTVVGWTTPRQEGIKPKPLYVEDVWTIDPKRGDCEDYAASKMVALLEQGVGRDHLRFALTKVRGVGHTVLLVETEKGWLLLDNLSAALSPDRYKILATETPGKAWKAR